MGFWKPNQTETKQPIKIQVKTPPGQATGTAAKIKLLIIGKKEHTLTINNDDSMFTWTINATLIETLRIQKKITMYEKLIALAFNNKAVLKMIKRYYSKDDLAAVEDMLKNQTRVTILK